MEGKEERENEKDKGRKEEKNTWKIGPELVKAN